MCSWRRAAWTTTTSGSSPFSTRHSIIEQSSACGSRVAQSSASSTVSSPSRSLDLSPKFVKEQREYRYPWRRNEFRTWANQTASRSE